MKTLYNEIDRYCCDWLSNLMDAGLITAGKIDDGRIEELEPDDIRGYERIHFFAGIGGWDLALRLAGWPTTRAVWTGSCPCQPFSAAGQGKAADDERHLWPDWFKLICAVRPPIVFGEQVESAIGWGWVDLVHADMAAQGYATRFAVLPACGVGAPHIRNRLWFVADQPSEQMGHAGFTWSSTVAVGLADSLQPGRQGRLFQRQDSQRGNLDGHAGRSGAVSELGQPDRMQPEQPAGIRTRPIEASGTGARNQSAGSSPWCDIEWIPCSDGKTRPAKPGIFPLAHGISARVGKLRAAGNAIVPQVAAEFIKATMTCG